MRGFAGEPLELVDRKLVENRARSPPPEALVSFTHERARVASLTRSRTADDPELLDARRNMRTERLADYIARVVDAAPPLTPAQRDRLALLLRPGVDAA